MKTRYMLTGIIYIYFCSIQSVSAASIFYDFSNISANTWEYTYTLDNDTSGFNIDEFTVYFDSGLYSNLITMSAPATWDPLVVEPNNFLNNDGFYDALALSGGVTPGSRVGSYSVRFNYLGTGTPGSQRFEIVDPSTFDVLDSGLTSLVPVPAAVWLFSSGLIGLIVVARRKA